MEKSINYTARDFNDIKSELINFSRKYYPEISDNFNDTSVGSWFIDLVSAVGDDLNYYIDKCYQENNMNSANLMSSILNIARMNNVKVPGPKASMCELRISCKLPVTYDNNISSPNWAYAPTINRGSVFGNADYQFELLEDVNFGEQFNSDGVSNRTFTPNKNNNGVLVDYTVTKSVIAYGGVSRVYKKVLTETDVEPFMEVILPERDIMNVESILFKESANFKYNPEMYEFYIDEEEFRVPKESVSTYRYFEVDSLSDQYRFGSKTRYANGSDGEQYVIDDSTSEVYEDYTETVGSGSSAVTRTSRYFKGEWKPITQKFITETTDNGYTKIIFGSATSAGSLFSTNDASTTYSKYIASKIVNNAMLGVLPRAGWTMYVLYRSGGGTVSNVAPGAINSVVNINVDFHSINAKDQLIKNSVVNSIFVNNASPSVGGKDALSAQEAKYFIKYSISSQNRCVTLKDYKAKIMSIPPKFGCPFRCNAKEENNKIVISTLGINARGKLDRSLPKIIAENLEEYLTHYKSLTDYVAIKSGKVYNLGIEVDVFVDKNYTTQDVVANVLTTIKEYMDVNNHDMGEDIFIGDLEREINSLDGVISLIDLRVYNLYGKQYGDRCPLPEYVEYGDACMAVKSESFVGDQYNSFRIDLDKIDSVLYSDYDSMFEILNPSQDIRCRVKLK